MNGSTASSGKVDLATFFALWADERRWEVPDIHWRAVHWLQNRGELAVFRAFRGFSKSTLLAVYNAWRYYDNPAYRILHQGDQDKTAFKTSRDTKAVLQRHPLTRNAFAHGIRGEASFWWVPGADDERNPSMQAAGITSNITSSRCDEAQNDDVEVPRNIQNPEARDKMRYRLGEQTHCMVPGARQLFIGTPHTHDSLYDEMERMGADCLTIPMFSREYRVEDAQDRKYPCAFKPEFVFVGIGANTRSMVEGDDWTWKDGAVHLAAKPGGLLDFYAESAWPERFTPKEMLARRRKCKTVNEWDSQYQLHSRPLHEVRLNPELIQPYDVEPVLRVANREGSLYLGKARLAGVACRWDPSSGKLHSDASAVAVVYQDEHGRRYWHRAERLTGEIAKFAEDGKTIIEGQVHQLVDLVEELHLPRVTVETNGIGAFAPAVLRAALVQRKVKCAVVEKPRPSSEGKNRTILEAMEPLIQSGYLWAHQSVLAGPVWDQMREWNPKVSDQPDDDLDAASGAIVEAPERIHAVATGAKIFAGDPRTVWSPQGPVHDITLEVDS